MAVPAGSKGGYIGSPKSLGIQIGDLPMALPRIWQQHQLWQVKTIGIYINSLCNLSCSFCYYQTPNGYRSRNAVSAELLNRAVDSARESHVGLFAFVGKEILIPGSQGVQKTLESMRHLNKRRSEGWPIHIGGITNGHFLDEAATDLRTIGLNFLDISFDGPDAVSHDQVRGPGSFVRSSRNLRVAIENEVADKVFVAATLYSGNLESLSRIFALSRDYGARHFSVMPIVAIRRTEHAISLDDLLWFLNVDVPSAAAKLDGRNRLELVVDLDSYMIQRRIEQFETFFAGVCVEIDALHNLLLRRQIGPIDLVVRLSLPDPCNGYGCFTHDGFYFNKGGCLFMKKGYEHFGLFSLQEQSLADHIRTHEEHAHEIGRTYSDGLLGKSSAALLRDVEETTFYEIPETA